MVNVQEYINQKYSNKEERKRVIELDISNQNLEGKLNVLDFVNLQELNCSNNQLTELNIVNCPNLEMLVCCSNYLTKLDLSNNLKLEMLNIGDNNFSEQDLSFLKHLVNLEIIVVGNKNREKIKKGIYNCFTGSLEPLENMNKLECLDIRNTDISNGLEHLPESLEEFVCLTKERPNSKVRKIYDLFADRKGSAEVDDYGLIKNFREKVKKIKKDNLERIKGEKREKIDQILKQRKESNKNMVNWKDININFTEELQKEWESKGFSYAECKDWINIGLTVNDAEYACWLKEIKKVDSDWVHNYGNDEELREEYIDEVKSGNITKKQRNIKSKDINIQQWLDSQEEYNTEEKRSKTSELYLNESKLTGELDLNDFKKLKKILISSLVDESKIAIKNKRENIEFVKCVQAKEWLDKNYPKKNRKKVQQLNIISEDLEGIVNLEEFDSIEILICNYNQITSLDVSNCFNLKWIFAFHNRLTSISLPVSNPSKLTKINLANNNFPVQDLSCFADFTNLEDLWVGNIKEKVESGIYNRFYGSLKVLKNLKKLERLDIEETNINSGLEYLPNSLEQICCDSWRKKMGCRELAEKLKDYKEASEYGYEYFDFRTWKKDNHMSRFEEDREMSFEGALELLQHKFNKKLFKEKQELEKQLSFTEQVNKERSKQKNSQITELEETRSYWKEQALTSQLTPKKQELTELWTKLQKKGLKIKELEEFFHLEKKLIRAKSENVKSWIIADYQEGLQKHKETLSLSPEEMTQLRKVQQEVIKLELELEQIQEPKAQIEI